MGNLCRGGHKDDVFVPMTGIKKKKSDLPPKDVKVMFLVRVTALLLIVRRELAIAANQRYSNN
jgi:hypothetical protein